MNAKSTSGVLTNMHINERSRALRRPCQPPSAQRNSTKPNLHDITISRGLFPTPTYPPLSMCDVVITLFLSVCCLAIMSSALEFLNSVGLAADVDSSTAIRADLSFTDLLAMATEYQKAHAHDSTAGTGEPSTADTKGKQRPSPMSLENILSPLLSESASTSSAANHSPPEPGPPRAVVSSTAGINAEKSLPSFSSLFGADSMLFERQTVSRPDPARRKASAPSSAPAALPPLDLRPPSPLLPAHDIDTSVPMIYGWLPPPGADATVVTVTVPGMHTWRSDHHTRKEQYAALAQAQRIQAVLAPLHRAVSMPMPIPMPATMSRSVPGPAYRSKHGAPVGGIPPSLAYSIARDSFLDIEKERKRMAAEREQRRNEEREAERRRKDLAAPSTYYRYRSSMPHGTKRRERDDSDTEQDAEPEKRARI
ncbi:hypothetical protein DENSPDRAFT_931774 [Dentipellis sp. KUC8613]|nr:hypothetical protein DENSPDRAFT_931774 [Dentipellis sp. KUC8613]